MSTQINEQAGAEGAGRTAPESAARRMDAGSQPLAAVGAEPESLSQLANRWKMELPLIEKYQVRDEIKRYIDEEIFRASAAATPEACITRGYSMLVRTGVITPPTMIVAGIDVRQLVRNLEGVSVDEGSHDLYCRCVDALAVIKGLLPDSEKEQLL